MMRAHSASHSQSTRSASGSGGRCARARARPLEYGRVGLHGTNRQRLGHFSIPLTHAQCSLKSSLFFRDLWSSHCIFQVSICCAVPWVFATAPSGPISCRVTSLLQSFEFAPLPSWFWCGFLQWTWRHLCKGESRAYECYESTSSDLSGPMFTTVNFTSSLHFHLFLCLLLSPASTSPQDSRPACRVFVWSHPAGRLSRHGRRRS